jgi:ketosteroid isomerase-like protein
MEAYGNRAWPAAVRLTLGALVLIATVVLAACGGSSKSGGGATTTASPKSTTASPVTAPAAADSAQVVRTESVVGALMATWNNAWSATRNRDGVLAFFADDVVYRDVTIDEVITKSDMDSMAHDPNWWKSFRLHLDSSFVSADGRFAATLGRIAIRDASGGLPWQPAASVLALTNDKVVWEYDYYGGEPGMSRQNQTMLSVPRREDTPGSSAAQAAVAASTATVQKWRAAYNARDAEAFLSTYSDNARYIDVVSPRWRVMTKSQLAADVASRFPRSEFRSRLAPEPGSPWSPPLSSPRMAATPLFRVTTSMGLCNTRCSSSSRSGRAASSRSTTSSPWIGTSCSHGDRRRGYETGSERPREEGLGLEGLGQFSNLWEEVRRLLLPSYSSRLPKKPSASSRATAPWTTLRGRFPRCSRQLWAVLGDPSDRALTPIDGRVAAGRSLPPHGSSRLTVATRSIVLSNDRTEPTLVASACATR